MNTSKKRRILSIAPVAVAVVLSLAACGAPCMAGSSSTPASNGASSSGALSNTAASSNGSVASNGTGTSGSSGTVGGSSFGASSGGSASGGSAVGGQGGTSSGGSASAGSATPGQAGVASGGFGNSTAAAGMTPDQVGAYCKSFHSLGTPEQDYPASLQVEDLTDMRKATPVQLVPNVDAMLSDYQAIDSQKRVYAQLKDELVANYGPLKDLNEQICVAH
jgi:hypothetical protein